MALGLEPRGGFFPTAPRHDVEELGVFHIDDRGRELGTVIRRLAKKGHLVKAQGLDHPEAIRILGQGLPVAQDGVVDGMPVTAEFFGHLTDTARAAPHPLGDRARRTPQSCADARRRCGGLLFVQDPIRQLTSGHVNRRLCQIRCVGGRVDGEINEFYLRAILHIGDHPALGAPLHYSDALHAHAKWTFTQILHPENIHLGKSDKTLIDGGTG